MPESKNTTESHESHIFAERFIKNADNVSDPSVRRQYSYVAGGVGIACNFLLFLMKLTAGIFMNSVSVMADSFNNLSDASSNIISIIGARMAGKPADREHPFGHGRIEYLSALIVAFIIVIVGFNSLKEAVSKIRQPEELSFQILPFVILLVSIGIKLWMGQFNSRIGRKIDSKVLTAAAADSRNDVIVTGVTAGVILLYRFTGINIDGIAGLFVSALVIWSGFSIAKDTMEFLIGGPENQDICTRIREITENRDGVLGTHDLILHDYGPGQYYATIHLEVPDDLDLETAHRIADDAEREVLSRMNISLTVHLDPVNIRDPQTIQLHELTVRILQQLDDRIRMHDFRVIHGKSDINLVFDIVVPYEYDASGRKKLLENIREKLRAQDPHLHAHIRCDVDGLV